MLGLEPMTREGHSVVPRLDDRKLFLKLAGTFDMKSELELHHYLQQVQIEARKLSVLELVIDVTEAYYLGSTCIKSFVTLTLGLQNGTAGMLLRVLTNPRLDWQGRAFSILARLAPNSVIIDKTA